MTRGSLYEFRIPTVYGHTRNLVLLAEILIAFAAEIAFTTSPVHPRNTHTVADFQIVNSGTFFYNVTSDFVPENQAFLDNGNKLRPIALGQMQIRMTYPARFHFDQYFLRSGFWPINVFDSQRLFEFTQDGGFHGIDLEEFQMRELTYFYFTHLTTERKIGYGCAPRKKNSTAFLTRSVSLWGPVRSTAHWRTTVLKRPSMNSTRCTTGKSRVISPFFCPSAMISRRRLTVAASAPRSSGERTGSIAPARMTACQSGRPTSVTFPRDS